MMKAIAKFQTRRIFFSRVLLTALLLSAVMVPGSLPPAFGQGLTEGQGETILKELGQIRELLQRMERRGALPAAPVATRPQTLSTAKVSARDRPVLGDSAAPLTLVEFTDYQCPYCKTFLTNTLPQLKAAYIDTGKLRVVVKDLPLSFHKDARKAAQAALCAHDQGRYWDMHQALFSSAQLGQAYLIGHAKQISLDVAAFERCLDSGRHLDVIDQDTTEAGDAGITGTPTFVLGRTTDDIVDGIRIRGARPFEAFETQIKALLKNLEG